MTERSMTSTAPSAANAQFTSLEGCKCTSCGRKYFPVRDYCLECGARDAMEPARIHGPGKLYSHSIVHIAPKTFKVPYAVGWVDFSGDIRVLGQIFGWEDAPLEQGMEMRIEYAPIGQEEDGSIRESFVFKRAHDKAQVAGGQNRAE